MISNIFSIGSCSNQDDFSFDLIIDLIWFNLITLHSITLDRISFPDLICYQLEE